jgi:hypothetical protein
MAQPRFTIDLYTKESGVTTVVRRGQHSSRQQTVQRVACVDLEND